MRQEKSFLGQGIFGQLPAGLDGGHNLLPPHLVAHGPVQGAARRVRGGPPDLRQRGRPYDVERYALHVLVRDMLWKTCSEH